jgi:predicted Zn-dependent protease
MHPFGLNKQVMPAVPAHGARARGGAAGLILLLVFQGCATNPVTGKKDFVMMTEQQEIQLGRQYHGEIMKQYVAYDDPALQAYVDRVGQELASNSHRSHLDFHFTVLDSPQVNAFALPGGYVYITRGIMAYMQDEADLAGVVGHEIGHVTARHSVRQQAQQTMAGLGVAVVAIGTGSSELANLSSSLGGALVAGYGRGMELESDGLGAEYLARSGYDPQNMIDVVTLLKHQELYERERAEEEGRPPSVYHGLYSTHPTNDRRLQEVIAAADKFKTSEVTRPNTGEFLKLTNGMTFGDAEEQGIVRGNDFYHKDLNLTLEFPRGWRLDNQPDRLIAVSGDGTQIIQMAMTDLEGESPEAYLRKNLADFGQGQRISSSMGQGYTGTGSLDAGNNQRVQTRVAIISGKNQQAYQLIGYGKSQLPNREVVDVARSMRNLKDAEKKFAEEKKIKLITAKAGDTFAGYARQSDLTGDAEAQLRLLNGMYPNGEPGPGQQIKLVE